MSITITDPALINALRHAADCIELRDADGEILGTFSAANLFKPPPGFKSPFTEEEMIERRKDRTGRPLADILRDLEARG